MDWLQRTTQNGVALTVTLSLALCACKSVPPDVFREAQLAAASDLLAIMNQRKAVASQVAAKLSIPSDDPYSYCFERGIEVQAAAMPMGYAVLAFGSSQIGSFGNLLFLVSDLHDAAAIREEADSLEELDSDWSEPAAFYVNEGTVYTVNARARRWAPHLPHDQSGLSYRDVRDAVISRTQVPGFQD